MATRTSTLNLIGTSQPSNVQYIVQTPTWNWSAAVAVSLFCGPMNRSLAIGHLDLCMPSHYRKYGWNAARNYLLRIYRSLAVAEFLVKSFALIMW